MKPFKFDQVDKRLNKKSHKEVEQEKKRQNFLKLYEEVPLDEKLQKLCEDSKVLFDEVRKNNRYYTLEEKKKEQNERSQARLRTQKIKRLSNFQMPFKEEESTQTSKQLTQQEIRKEKIRKLNVRRKFRYQLKLVMQKMRRLNLTIEEILSKNIFSKQPYKFGNQIFTATKQSSEEKVWRSISQNKYSIYSLDNTQKTALFWACIRGNEKIAKMLIDAGIDVDKKDIHGYTALNYAIQYNHPQCVKLLMIHLASLDYSHEKDAHSTEEKVRRVFQLGINLRKNLQNLQYRKRMQLFEQQYNYLYK